jgi:hypothetical protein
MSMKRRNSARVRASLRNTPVMRLVTIDTLRLWTPRVVMHSCTAETTTPTPRGLSTWVMQLAICAVSFPAPGSAGITIHDARELADTHYLVRRQVAHVHAPDDRRHGCSQCDSKETSRSTISLS